MLPSTHLLCLHGARELGTEGEVRDGDVLQLDAKVVGAHQQVVAHRLGHLRAIIDGKLNVCSWNSVAIVVAHRMNTCGRILTPRVHLKVSILVIYRIEVKLLGRRCDFHRTAWNCLG